MKILSVPEYNRVDDGRMIYGSGRPMACFKSFPKWEEYISSYNKEWYKSTNSFGVNLSYKEFNGMVRRISQMLNNEVGGELRNLCIEGLSQEDLENSPKEGRHTKDNITVWYDSTAAGKWFLQRFNFKIEGDVIYSDFGRWIVGRKPSYDLQYADNQPSRWLIEQFNEGFCKSGTWTHTNGAGTFTCEYGVWNKMP